MAQGENLADRKNAMFDIAGSALEQARALDPNDKQMLQYYAGYWRVRGMNDKAVELLERAQDENLLWGHYVQSGQFENAKVILERLHQSAPQNSDVIKGLLLVAERTRDREAVKKHSEELISLEDSKENSWLQVSSYLNVGLVKEAETKVQSFTERYPEDPSGMQLGAAMAMKQGRLKEALELANRTLETDQENAGAWRLRGQINSLMTNYDKAISDLLMSKSLSNAPITRFYLANAYLGDGQRKNATTELVNMINDAQAPPEARMLLERIYRTSGRVDKLVQLYSETLNKFPDSVLWHNRAGAFMMNAKNYDEAERLYGQAWEKCDKNDASGIARQAFNGYLQALVSGKKFDALFAEAGKYTDGHFAPVAFIWMAKAKLDLGDRETAVQHCRKAVDKAGTNVNLASLMLQMMYSSVGGEQVQRYCEEKLAANPNELTANLTMYNLARLRNEYNKAVKYVDKCLEIIGPDSPEKVDYVSKKVSLLQQAFNKTSDKTYLQKAIAEYQSLLDETPNNTNVLNNMAYMLAQSDEKERLPDALKHIKRVHELRPNDPRFLDTYAYVLYKNGDFADAEARITSSFQQYDTWRMAIPGDVYEHKGMIKEKVGKKDEALKAYEQALKVGASTLLQTAKERILAAIERLKR